MKVLKPVFAVLFLISFAASSSSLAQQQPAGKPPAKPRSKEATKPTSASPLDAVMDALYAAHTFEQTTISPDGKKIAWVETLLGKNGVPDGNTAIYLADRESATPPKRITAASPAVARSEGRNPMIIS